MYLHFAEKLVLLQVPKQVRSAALLAALLAALAPLGGFAAIPLVEIYDEDVFSDNSVNAIARGSTLDLAGTKAAARDAYRMNRGGVWNMDEEIEGVFDSDYRDSYTLFLGNSSETITFSLPWNGEVSRSTGLGNAISASGPSNKEHGWMGIGNQNDRVWTPDLPLTFFAITTSRSKQALAVTATLANGTTIATEKTTVGAGEYVLHALTASEGNPMTEITWEVDGFVRFDDFAFAAVVDEIPEASAAALALISLSVIARRRLK